ncbi:MAG: hypothetical protein JJV92_00455 [Desulfosarcina sp.]|nr:hypothetical protein [Desulfobacterales bacterium]
MKVFCMLGDKRALRSKTPAMYTKILKRVGMKGACVPFMVEPDQIGQALQSIKVLNMTGAILTIPFKETVIPHLDILSEGANIIGAVNTIIYDGKILKGYNTNAIGFMDAVDEAGFDLTGKSALVFGSGGTARAVVFILNWLRAASIFIAGENEEKTFQITKQIGGETKSLESLPDKPVLVDIVVNATVQSTIDEMPEFADLVNRLETPECKLIVDMNYGSEENFWKDMADSRGIKFIDALPVLAHQAKRTFALLTKTQVDTYEFMKALESL